MFYGYLTHGYFALKALYFPFYGNKAIQFYDFPHLWSTHKYQLDPGRCWASGPGPEKPFRTSLSMKLILGFKWHYPSCQCAFMNRWDWAGRIRLWKTKFLSFHSIHSRHSGRLVLSITQKMAPLLSWLTFIL